MNTNSTLLDLILDEKYLPAVGVALVAIVGFMRTVLLAKVKWLQTKIGGYALAYVAALVLYVATALQAETAIDGRLLVTAFVAALMSSGVLDHWRDILDFTKKSPGAAAAGGSVVAILFTMISCTGCPGTAPTGGSVITATVNCFNNSPDVQAKIDAEIAEMSKLAFGLTPDWTKVENLAINGGLQVGGCAIAQVVNEWITKKSLGDGDAVAQTKMASATLEHYRSHYANNASFRTARGDL